MILIAPSWLITATHVAKLKAEDPSRHIEVSFDNGTKCEVSEVFMAEGVDVSLVHLKTPMKGVPPAGLLSQTILDKDGLVEFTLAGHSGGLHCHPHRKAKGEAQGHVRQIAAKDDPNPGRGGDSGGAWAVEDAATGLPVVFATIHGGGLANQLAPLREWIDGKMKASGEAAKWVACKLPVATTQPK